MAFPVTPLPLRALIAPGADPADPSSWSFVDITDDVRVADGVTIQVGRQDEGSQTDTTKVSATIDNRDGHYSRVNPLGAYFGRLGRGTPLEARVTRITDTFSRVTGSGWGTEPSSGLIWSHTNIAKWSTSGSGGSYTAASPGSGDLAILTEAAGHDVEITYTASVPAVMTGSAWAHGAVIRYADTSNYYKVHTEFRLGGGIGVKVARMLAGANSDLGENTSTGVTYTSGTRIRSRVRAVGKTIQVRVWLESGTEPDVWHLQVDDDQVTGTGTGIFEWRVPGNTNPGSLTVTVDDFRMDVIRATTPVPEWPVRWDQTGTNVVAPLVGAGTIRRLSQGQAALRSSQYRQITSYTRRRGHWTLEDGSEAGRLANTYPGGQMGTFSGTTLGDSGGPGGAASVAKSPAGSFMGGVFVLPDFLDNGFQFAWSCKLTAAPTGTFAEMIRFATTGGHLFSFQVSDTRFKIVITDGPITLLDSQFLRGANDPQQWMSYRVKVTESGGTVTVEPAWFSAGSSTVTGVTDSYVYSLGRLQSWRQTTNAMTTDALWSHVFGVTTGTDNLHSYRATRAFDGYAGETAGDRLERLAAEEGVLLAVTGDVDDTMLMGPQRPGTLLELMRECEEADQGVLYERGAGLAYLTRATLYNQNPVMELDFDDGHIAAPPEPVDDDQRLRNRVTATRVGGSEETVEDEDSIAEVGIYSDELTVNLEADSQLKDYAAWRLHLGTQDGLRWPRIELNLARNPSLIAAWCRVRIGSRITIEHPPDAVGTDALDLIVEGWTETMSIYSWDVVLVCSPAKPWLVGVYDDTDARYDSASTTLVSTVAAGVTSLPITSVYAADAWSVSDGPFNWLIAGEEMTVTAVTAPAGSGPYTQTATVTRAVNGISKALPAGSEVVLAYPARYAL
ncbi:hypothetical protein OHA21_43865 [Actinoplanes sp. NBC_00393]|uniref:hypothetical protein n=1 Tax=Actinoplanes sp. NBC_00393 TaxID=2975953 RepID=UPI002E1C4A29